MQGCGILIFPLNRTKSISFYFLPLHLSETDFVYPKLIFKGRRGQRRGEGKEEREEETDPWPESIVTAKQRRRLGRDEGRGKRDEEMELLQRLKQTNSTTLRHPWFNGREFALSGVWQSLG
jgi:hypothetical protein